MRYNLSKMYKSLLPAVFLSSALAAAAAPSATLAATDAVLQTTSIWLNIPTSSSPLQSLKVVAPASGYMIVTVAGSVNFTSIPGTQGYYCVALSQTLANTGGCTPNAGSDSAMRNYIPAGYPAQVAGFGQLEGYSIVKVWPVVAGRTYTFYLNGSESGLKSAYLFQPSITALYVPGALAP